MEKSKSLLDRITAIGAADDDSKEVSMQKSLLVLSTLMITVAAICWGIIYIYFDEPIAAALPLSYSMASIVGLVIFSKIKRYELFSSSQLLLTLMLPFFLMIALGGFINSSGVIMWGLTSPLGALLFTSCRQSSKWFVAFALLVFIAAGIETASDYGPNNLPPYMIRAFFVLNIAAVSTIAFVLMFYFVNGKKYALYQVEIERNKLEKSYDRVRQANEYKTQVLGMVAHDLRNPLGQITGFAELIRLKIQNLQDEIVKEVFENLDYIMEAGKNMGQQVERILVSAKEEADALPVNVGPANISQIIQQGIRVNEITAAQKNITLRYAGPDEFTCNADSELILEALDNLISNAIKYSYPDTTVTVGVIDGADDIELFVSDQGQGVEEQDMEKAFKRFQRLSAKPTGGEDSVGLGLFNVRIIAEHHDGRVAVKSEGKDKGARFSIFLPLGELSPLPVL